jgi:U32 family peptidase
MLQDKIELLAPAGNFEKLEIAIHYGADAVYLAGKKFSLRSLSQNFDNSELYEAIKFAHKNKVKVYVALNIYPRNSELADITAYLKELNKIKPDALIIADPGVLLLAKDVASDIPLHLSTQANTTNYNSVNFWKKFNVTRVNLARELSFSEIKKISQQCDIEIETFVHGAMCISYSGRCLLSSFMAKRDSNRGFCSHPCRWKYYLVEDLRPKEYMPIYEDDKGTYIFNSKDLCMIEHIPEIIENGINSLKIEGRMKGIHYLATVLNVYRDAIDSYYENKKSYAIKEYWIKELAAINNRGYSKGFYFGDPDETACDYENKKNDKSKLFVAKVIEDSEKIEGAYKVFIQVRNKIFTGDFIEIIKKKKLIKDKILYIQDENQIDREFAQPGEGVYIFIQTECGKNDLIRRANKTAC